MKRHAYTARGTPNDGGEVSGSKSLPPTSSASPWRSLRYDPPRKDSSFVVATDVRWMRGERGNKDCIVLDFLKDHQVVLELGSWELEGRYWMEVPMHLLPNKKIKTST